MYNQVIRWNAYFFYYDGFNKVVPTISTYKFPHFNITNFNISNKKNTISEYYIYIKLNLCKILIWVVN